MEVGEQRSETHHRHLAGAMAAPYDMLLLTIGCPEEIKATLPFPIQVTLHADDLNLTVSASSEGEAYQRLEQATRAAPSFEQNKFQVEKKQIFFVTSCDELDGKVRSRLIPHFGGQVVPQVRRLG